MSTSQHRRDEENFIFNCLDADGYTQNGESPPPIRQDPVPHVRIDEDGHVVPTPSDEGLATPTGSDVLFQ
eukprot:5490493-Alexandrium_andersonii.AAC.1